MNGRSGKQERKKKEKKRRNGEKGHAEESVSYANESECIYSRGFYIARAYAQI